MAPLKRHRDYTVGWVAIIDIEVMAFRALLDEEHEPLSRVGNDDNSYILGRMGNHNVVMTFPVTYGTSPAAEAVTNMLRSFRNIRFGLLVGIGGGAPQSSSNPDPQKDIRLGDVVVSFPEKDLSGVMQWDMGTEEESGSVIKSHLNKPPPLLLKAMKLLKVNHANGSSNMQKFIDQALQSNIPGMEAARHPGLNEDLLFKTGCKHYSGDDCSTCDKTKIVKRRNRASTDVRVHYGQIASGNMVMRNAKKRDYLRGIWRVMCFEMEAAGLVDKIPCTVIRGICDYSDSHKNKRWQPYAALTAAAYAKDLLLKIQPEEAKSLQRASDEMGTGGKSRDQRSGLPRPPRPPGGPGRVRARGIRRPSTRTLFDAIRKNQPKRISRLLRMSVDPNRTLKSKGKGRIRQNALHFAASLGRSNASRLILPKIANIHATDGREMTALDVALVRGKRWKRSKRIRSGRRRIATLLRSHGA